MRQILSELAQSDRGLQERIAAFHRQLAPEVLEATWEIQLAEIPAKYTDRHDYIDDNQAYHWYSGDHFDALQMLEQKYPGKILMHSESCGLHIPGKPSAFDVPEEEINRMPAEKQSLFRKNPPSGGL